MKKTSVYLTEDEAAALREAAARTGRSQAELIREGVHLVSLAAGAGRRTFHSMGKGHGGGRAYQDWSSDDLYEEVMGHRH